MNQQVMGVGLVQLVAQTKYLSFSSLSLLLLPPIDIDLVISCLSNPARLLLVRPIDIELLKMDSLGLKMDSLGGGFSTKTVLNSKVVIK